jgi:hypothetical protein
LAKGGQDAHKPTGIPLISHLQVENKLQTKLIGGKSITKGQGQDTEALKGICIDLAGALNASAIHASIKYILQSFVPTSLSQDFCYRIWNLHS